MSDLKFFREPTVYPLGLTGERQPYFIGRTLRTDTDRGIQTQALAVSGEWVDRPEGFTADAEITFYGKPGQWLPLPLTPSQHLMKALAGFYVALKRKVRG